MDGSRGGGSKAAGGNGAPTKGKPYRVIGKPNPKVDAWDKCTGVTKFADDLVLPRMLHAKLLRSIVPHARITRIDTSKAEKLRGNKADRSGKDLASGYENLPRHPVQLVLALEKVRMV